MRFGTTLVHTTITTTELVLWNVVPCSIMLWLVVTPPLAPAPSITMPKGKKGFNALGENQTMLLGQARGRRRRRIGPGQEGTTTHFLMEDFHHLPPHPLVLVLVG